MKAAIKKLRTCTFSREASSTSFMGKPVQHTNKLVCDHPEKKAGWALPTCEKCEIYQNRNLPPVPEPAPAPPEPEPIPTPVVAPPQEEVPKKPRGRKPKATPAN
jgi:hypothetical protein